MSTLILLAPSLSSLLIHPSLHHEQRRPQPNLIVVPLPHRRLQMLANARPPIHCARNLAADGAVRVRIAQAVDASFDGRIKRVGVGDRVGEKRKSNIGEKSLRPCSIGTCVPMKWGFDDGFHVYGLEWNDTSIVIYADGNQVGDAFDASCFAQKIGMDFDRETMPGWMGTPDLPFAESAPFEIDYVRVWKPSEGDDNILF